MKLLKKTRADKLEHIEGQLSEASKQQLVVYLIKFSKIAMQAENTGARISGDGGLQLGLTIVEYLKRTDKDVKKALKETEW